MAECPPRFTLASLRVGDLPPVEARRVEEHVAACAECRAALDEIDANVAEYGARADDHLAQLMDRIAREPAAAEVVPLRARRSRLVPVAIAAGSLAAAAVLALVLVPVLTGPDAGGDRPDVLFKGSLAVEIVAKRGADQFLVTDGAGLRPGDAIRFVVTTGEPGWLTVFSIDAAGRLSPFYPDSEPSDDPEPLWIARAGRQELPGSIILDDSRGHEEIVVIFSATAFDRASAHRKVTGARSPAAAAEVLGSGFALKVVRVVKETP